MEHDEIEGLALGVLEEIGAEDDPSIEAEIVAACLGRRLFTAPGRRAWLDGDAIAVPTALRPERVNRLVAHELAHSLLLEHGKPNTERYADSLAAALIVPRRAMDRSLRTLGWDLSAIRERHPLASAELLARRLCELREAVVTIVDNGRVVKRVASPWFQLPPWTPGHLEREAFAAVADTAEPAIGAGVVAFPFFEGGYRRVIVVRDLEAHPFRER